MLSELKITNFRLFDDQIIVRFRPITVLIGRNSAGKSSVLKFLLMLQQSIGPGKPFFLSPEGEQVSLGNFSDLKNALTKKRNLAFELSARTEVTQPGKATATYIQIFNKSAATSSSPKLLYKTNVSIPYGQNTTGGRTITALVNIASGRTLVEHNDIILEGRSFLDPSTLTDVDDYMLAEINKELQVALTEDPVPNEQITSERINEIVQNSRAFAKITTYISAKYELLDTIRYQITSIRHLGPVRNESPKVIRAASLPADYVGKDGAYTLPHLQQMMLSDEKEGFNFIFPHLQNSLDLQNISFEGAKGFVSRAYARNQTTGAEVLISEFGFGVSQCLPILVQGAIMAPHTSLVVEQPESQLHPTAQLELGNFFADLWNERRVGSIIETHSSNILLRLRRMIARGELSHTDVSVAFFTNDKENRNMPIVRNLDINEDGSMEHGLPMEFFGADVIEGLNLGARI